MKRLLACLLGVALACSLSSAASAKTYVNGIDANYPPFSFVGEDGNPTGFDIEAMNWIAAKMGFEVKHQPMDWDGIIPASLPNAPPRWRFPIRITPFPSSLW